MSRNTVQQDIICNTVKSMTTHPSPDQVYEEVRMRHPSIGRATVYRALNKLADKGEIRRVSIPNTADRFDFRTDEHVHMHCTKCNGVFDVDMDDVRRPLEEITKTLQTDHREELHGFEITECNLSFKGICKDCREKLSHKLPEKA